MWYSLPIIPPAGTIQTWNGGPSPEAVAVAVAGPGVDPDLMACGFDFPEIISPFPAMAFRDYTWIPQYFLEAGTGPDREVQNEQVARHVAFRTEWLKAAMGLSPRKIALITARGDSMEPVVCDGDLLLTDLRELRTIDPAIYVLRMDNALTAKRIRILDNGRVRILSDNPAHGPREVPAREIAILGRVVWIGRKPRPGRELSVAEA
ncbi:MAG: hypothetical protein HQL82_12130 [Magnetococcales bacterium]|nr:hypothetical protein [Magnetococcales bacterium]